MEEQGWWFEFTRQSVTAKLGGARVSGEKRGLAEDILRVMRRVPVEGTDESTLPPKLEDGFPYFYRSDLVPQAEFADKSPEEVRDLTLAKVEAFLDSDSSDYQKVGRYLEVLAFQPSPG